jgi:hypothetical protein
MKTAALLIFVYLLAIAMPVGAASPPIRGIYALTTPNPTLSQIPKAVLTNPYVDGLALRVGWSALEPSIRNFQWSQIDSVVSLAASYGKTVSISVQAGIQSPTWLYSNGARSFKFMWDLPYGPAQCTQVLIPVPWDPVFQARWAEFVAAFGARYGSNPHITFVKLTGLNSQTEETMLPNAVAGTPINGGRCRAMNDVQDWLNLGYTRTKVENAWFAMANEFDRAFPNRQFAAMMVPGGFPPIDDNGYLIPNMGCDYQATEDMLSYGITSYGMGSFIGQNNGLSNTWIYLVLARDASKIDTGFQMTSQLGSKLPQAINLALQNSADYLEIYPADISDPSLQTAIKQAHQTLIGK